MTIKIVIIVYSDLLREKTVTVVPLFLITVGLRGLVRRVIASLLSSFLLREIFLSCLRRAFCSFLMVWKADRISSTSMWPSGSRPRSLGFVPGFESMSLTILSQGSIPCTFTWLCGRFQIPFAPVRVLSLARRSMVRTPGITPGQ